MVQTGKQEDEAAAVARVADAAREVQAASSQLQSHFASSSEPPALHLARFAAAMSELQAAREAFDALLASKSDKAAR
jgi:hypothetical protein